MCAFFSVTYVDKLHIFIVLMSGNVLIIDKMAQCCSALCSLTSCQSALPVSAYLGHLARQPNSKA